MHLSHSTFIRSLYLIPLGALLASSTGCDLGNIGDPASNWTAASSPCASDLDALWFDDASRGYAGCGTNASGGGLFVTTNGGASWGDSARKFGPVRVNDIRRMPDGELYGAGNHTSAGYSAFRIDGSGDSLEPVMLFDPGDNAFSKVAQAENIARTADGQMMVDSLTGTSAAYKPADSQEWTELEQTDEAELSGGRDAYQVRRILAHGNRFWAAGSIINDPAKVRLPSREEGATYHFQTLALQSDNEDGELHDMHIWSDTEMIVAGFDQSLKDPLIFVCDGDPYSRDSWTRIELFEQGIDFQGDINALSVQGDTVVAVGEKVPTSLGGFVLRSEDRGRTWQDITPELNGSIAVMTDVWVWSNGDIYAGGRDQGWRYEAD